MNPDEKEVYKIKNVTGLVVIADVFSLYNKNNRQELFLADS